jgi:hypothetical protein
MTFRPTVKIVAWLPTREHVERIVNTSPLRQRSLRVAPVPVT